MSDVLLQALEMRASNGPPVHLWLRDDDATVPGEKLDTLLGLTEGASVPVTLAVIPALSGQDLANRLARSAMVNVAVHGWAHLNHAQATEKKQELGHHRAPRDVLAELEQGFAHLARLYPTTFVPVLVPPWNRISAQVVAGLSAIGFEAVSCFGPEVAAPLPMVNTHIDVIDWRTTRRGRSDADLMDALALAIGRGNGPIGVLTHHLVHDAQVWGFLERLFALTLGHSGCRWTGLPEIIASP